MDQVDFPWVTLNNRGRMAASVIGETNAGATPALVVLGA
jgi:hypothetical protein